MSTRHLINHYTINTLRKFTCTIKCY